MRQLFDFKTGARRGPWGELMKPVVDSLSIQELMAVSAYASSIAPPATSVVTAAGQAR
jgi:cytochrome c553